MDKDKSLIRAKNSAMTLVQLLAKEGVTNIVPGGGLIYDLTQALVTHGRNYYTDQSESRLQEFHKNIINGFDEEAEFNSFINKEFNISDYNSILSACIQDIEDEKTIIYASLIKSLIRKDVTSETRKHFIITSKDLSFSELNLLKELYINSNFDLMTLGGINQQIKQTLSKTNILKAVTINKLSRYGLINEKLDKLTELGNQYITMIFSKNSLLPEAIHRKQFSGLKFLLISYQLGDSMHDNVCQKLQDELWSKNIKSMIHIMDSHFLKGIHLYDAAILLVDNKNIEDNHIESLDSFLSKKPIFKLNLLNSTQTDSVNKLKFTKEITLHGLQKNDFEFVISEIIGMA